MLPLSGASCRLSTPELSSGLTAKTTKRIAVALGIGLALFPLHWANQPLIDYIFLPQLGLVFILGSVTAYFMLCRKFDWRTLFGPRLIWIPMLVIVLSMVLQIAVHPGKQSAGVALLGISMFLVYLVARDLGKSRLQDKVKLPVVLVLVVVVIGGIIVGVSAPGTQDGGVITNYCAAVGFLVFAGLMTSRKWLWLAVTPILLSAFLIGALEGVFVIGVMMLIVLLRRDCGKKILIPIGVVVLTVILTAASGKLSVLYYQSSKNIQATIALVTGQATEQYGDMDNAISNAFTGRWRVIVDAVTDIRILGHGFTLTPNPDNGDREPVHNTPLLITDQVGPLAGLAWLWVSVYCLVRTRWKYIWAAVLVTSLLDYYIWTQFAPWWWVFIGLSTTDTTHRDLIFREQVFREQTA
jgi:hypothetical protein